MVKAGSSGLRETFMKDSFTKEASKAMASTPGPMEESTKENGKTIKWTVLESSLGLTAGGTPVST